MIDLTFLGRYIVPLVVPVIVGVIGILMLDEAFNDDDDDDEAEKARALVAARGRSIIALGISISVDELIVGFTIGYSQYFTTLQAIIAIVVQSFLALMAGLYFGRKARDGKIRISAERVSTGTKLIAGGILVTLSAVLLVGPPLATHAYAHFMHSVFPHKVIPSPAPRRSPPTCREPADKPPPGGLGTTGRETALTMDIGTLTATPSDPRRGLSVSIYEQHLFSSRTAIRLLKHVLHLAGQGLVGFNLRTAYPNRLTWEVHCFNVRR